MTRLRASTRTFLLCAASIAAISIPNIALGSSHDVSNYQPLAGFGSLSVSAGTFSEYFTNLFSIALLMGSIAAVLIIASAGLKYMTTDAVSGKTESKYQILNAVLGLLMLLGIWLFFNEINPNILNLDLSLQSTNTQIQSAQQTQTNTAAQRAARNQSFPGSTIGASYTNPTWTDIPSNQLCTDVRGFGWVNIDDHHCVGASPSSTSRCCGLNPGASSSPQSGGTTSSFVESYFAPNESSLIPTGSWCYVLPDDTGFSCYRSQNACVVSRANDVPRTGSCEQR